MSIVVFFANENTDNWLSLKMLLNTINGSGLPVREQAGLRLLFWAVLLS